MRITVAERLRGGAGAAAMVGALAWMLLFGLPVGMTSRIAQQTQAIALQPAHKVEPPPQMRVFKLRRTPARAAAASPRARATPLVVPLPTIAPTPLPAALLPDIAIAPATGASDRAGTGSGGGEAGSGTGAGGDGEGDRGDDGTPPTLIHGRLKVSDLPQDLRDNGVQGTVGVRYEVRADGSVGPCEIAASSGTPVLDDVTCALIAQRFRFSPARDRDGHPVAATIEEAHRWNVESAISPPSLPGP